MKKPVTRKVCPIARALQETRHRNALRLRLGRAILDGRTSPGQVQALREELLAEEEFVRWELQNARRYWRKLTQARREGW